MRVLVTGASGLLGRYVLAGRPAGASLVGWAGRACEPAVGVSLAVVALEDAAATETAYRLARPAVVLHLAACASVRACQREPERARAINADAAGRLARLARGDGAAFVFASTDLVFDGTSPPYDEESPTNPLSVYGRTKRDGEHAVLDAGGSVVRFALLFGPGRGGRTGFFDAMLSALRDGPAATLFHDEYRTPLDLASAAAVLWGLARLPGPRLVHAGGPERLSRLEMGLRLAAFLGVAEPAFLAVSRTSLPDPEPRPADTSLDSARLTALLPGLPRPTYEQALAGLLV